MSSTSVLNSDNFICIGCGLCAAICPEENIKIMWNEFGEIVPKEINTCALACGLCENVCPFKNRIYDEDTIGKELYGSVSGISHYQETGYYLDSIVGYAKEFRLTSASGGLATWFLETAMCTGLVDKIICVTKTENPEKLFEFKIINTKEDIRAGAGSVYYPVEMSEVISFVLNNPGNYAITGLPCFVKAIRLAQKKNNKLKRRIVLTIGLTCGQLKTKHFTDYIAQLAGVRGEIKRVRYRCKEMNYPPGNYYFSFNSQDGGSNKIFLGMEFAKHG